MRNLTITRRKSFVGCAVKDQVYIRDDQAWEIMISGVPCRKLGDIKNGEKKTFPIGEGQQQIFLIADKLSKDYCNASVTVPEGQEDAELSGKHYFVLGSNPFRFDGVQLTVEQIAQQKKNGRKGKVIIVAAAIIGGFIGVLLPGGFINPYEPDPQVFQKGDFQITLNADFEETQLEGFYAVYSSDTALVFAVREDAEQFGHITLDEYGKLVLEANNRTNAQLNKGEDFLWFAYTDTPEEQEIYYLAVCCESDGAFWIVNFATPATNQNRFQEVFLQWAETIEVAQ